jgi:hypothetical protein
MLGLTLAAMAMLEQASAIIWKNDGTVEITATFTAKDPSNPIPQGGALLNAKAAEACGDKGAPVPAGEPVVTGLAITDGGPQITMSGVYACRKS